MEVYKFGGASVKDAAAVRNVAAILKSKEAVKKVVVISAMGKTTNALEEVVNAYQRKDTSWKEKLEAVYLSHQSIIAELFNERSGEIEVSVKRLFVTVRDFLQKEHASNYRFVYDQVVSLGEYVSTTIVSHYCRQQGLSNTLLDARTCIHTDNAYTEGVVDFKKTEQSINALVPKLLENGFVITQGFVGGTAEGFTTTLGREGSDYTAAIFSYSLQATCMTVWKDVEGVMNADPKEFSEAQLLPELSYHEAIEMTYYGASVIHPKTIKPLQNRNIPLEVRSFIAHQKSGTIISVNANTHFLPPIIILKRAQILLSFSTRDFSFIAEEHLSKIFAVFGECRLRANMMQNAAISYSVVVDFKQEKIAQIKEALQQDFAITTNENLTLLTVRHYNTSIIDRLTKHKDILLQQVSRNTMQLLMRV